MTGRGGIARLPFYRGDDLVGWLFENGSGLLFEYAPGYQGNPVSPLLPVGEELPRERVRAWFGELLPSRRRREAFERLTKLSLDRIAEFLAWHGEDLPGDLSTAPASSLREARDITRMINDLIADGDSLDYAAFKLSLAGGEPKTAVRVKNGRFYHPSSAQPSTHIVKGSRHYTVIEACSMFLAEKCRLFPTARARVIASGGREALLIRRFDREALPDGSVRRLAQEDFCQALGRDGGKYQFDANGVSYLDMAELMRNRALPAGDIAFFIRMAFFNMLIGDSDDHAKNFALVDSDGWRLAPAYDILSAAACLDLAGTPAMPMGIESLDLEQARSFGAHYDAFDVDSRDFQLMSDAFRIPARELRSNLLLCVSRMKENCGRLPRLPKLAEHRQERAEMCLAAFRKTVPARIAKLAPILLQAAKTRKTFQMR